LVPVIDGKLTQQYSGNRIGPVSLRGFWQIGAFDLRGGQGYVADDAPSDGIAHHVCARRAGDLISPCVPLKPLIEGLSSAIEPGSVIFGYQRPGRRQSCHAGRVAASL
jgi:hypothetical protein